MSQVALALKAEAGTVKAQLPTPPSRQTAACRGSVVAIEMVMTTMLQARASAPSPRRQVAVMRVPANQSAKARMIKAITIPPGTAVR